MPHTQSSESWSLTVSLYVFIRFRLLQEKYKQTLNEDTKVCYFKANHAQLNVFFLLFPEEYFIS